MLGAQHAENSVAAADSMNTFCFQTVTCDCPETMLTFEYSVKLFQFATSLS